MLMLYTQNKFDKAKIDLLDDKQIQTVLDTILKTIDDINWANSTHTQTIAATINVKIIDTHGKGLDSQQGITANAE